MESYPSYAQLLTDESGRSNAQVSRLLAAPTWRVTASGIPLDCSRRRCVPATAGRVVSLLSVFAIFLLQRARDRRERSAGAIPVAIAVSTTDA
jgi:hypothetical protein